MPACSRGDKHETNKHQILMFVGLSIIFTCYSVLGTVRTPNSWSLTQIAWTYHQGFIKRGLFGEILHLVFNVLTLDEAEFISFTIFAIEIALMIFLASKATIRHPTLLLPLSLFFLSPAMSYLVHTIGYLDHILIILALIVAWLPKRYASYFIILCIIGTLVHELFFIIIAPILLMRGLLACLDEGKTSRTARIFFCLTLFSFLLTLSIDGLSPVFTRKQTQDFASYTQSWVEYPIAHNNLRVLRRDYATNWNLRVTKITPKRLRTAFPYVPDFVLYVCIACIGLRFTYPMMARESSMLLLVCVIGLFLFPITALLWGSDNSRFFCITETVGFILLLSILKTLPPVNVFIKHRTLILLCSLIVAAWNLTHAPQLKDHYKRVKFPFMERWEYLSKNYESNH